MPLVSATGLGKHYGTRVLFENVDFTLDEGARVALIGANGTGKSTILQIIRGGIEHDGTVARKKDLRITALEQDPTFAPDATVREALLAGDPEIAKLEHQMHDIHERLERGEDTERLLARLAEIQTRFEHLGGYTLENRADRMLDGVGFPAGRHEDPVATLSGGERNRVAFARLLMTEPDLWLLDEPTNHLDLDGILFLEEILRASKGAAVVVSHDRRFLDRTTTETWELEGEKLYRYPAPYTRAKELRAERIKSEQRAYAKQQVDIQKTEEFIRRYQAGQRARQATGRKKLLERLARLDRPEDQARLMALDLPPGESLGVRALAIRDLAVAYEELPVFRDLSLEVEARTVLGIVGPNGAGKTSLLRVLLGELAPTEGKVTWSPRAKFGILRQHEDFGDDTLTPFSYLRQVERRKTDLELRNALAALLFRGDDVDKPVSVLSGGERKRLMLTRLLFEGNNILLLDEPTNHLDLPSREALELALMAYEGTLIVVSHDRYFLDQVADRVLWLENGEGRVTEGGFEEALARRKRVEATRSPKAKPVVVAAPAPPPAKSKSPLSNVKTSDIESRIIRCEEKLKLLETQFASPEVYRNPDRLREVRQGIEETKQELSMLEAEYATRTR